VSIYLGHLSEVADVRAECIPQQVQAHLHFLLQHSVYRAHDQAIALKDTHSQTHARKDAQTHMGVLTHVSSDTCTHTHTHTYSSIRRHVHADTCNAQTHMQTHMHIPGHMTKNNQIAGPKAMIHMVDVVLRLEEDMSQVTHAKLHAASHSAVFYG